MGDARHASDAGHHRLHCIPPAQLVHSWTEVLLKVEEAFKAMPLDSHGIQLPLFFFEKLLMLYQMQKEICLFLATAKY